MTFEISPVQLLTLSSILNCLVYSVLVLFKKENRQANYFLSLLLFSLCLTFTPYIVPSHVFNNNLWLTFMPFSLTYWIGPALYFYVKSLTSPDFKFSKKSLWHFSLIVLNYLHSIYHLSVGDNFILYPLHATAEFLEFSAIFSILIYAHLSMKILKQYNVSILNQLSSIEHLHLKWVKHLIKTLVIIFIIIAIYLILTNEVLEKKFPSGIFVIYRQIFLGAYALVLYWLSIGGFKQTQIINNPIDLKLFANDVIENKLTARLLEQMRAEQLFKDPLLTLNSLSKRTNIPEKEITTLLNSELKKNFYTFVNELRVEAVKEMLLNPKYEHLKIISLAYDSGFNSKATFNRIFKQQVGMTPLEFRRSNA